jgi:CRISPR-associated endonuclease/helicase Cas3
MATSASVSKPAWSFDRAFAALTGNLPYPWQEKIFDLFLRGEIRPDINLPTGAGKTSIMAIWLIALARQAEEAGAVALPRRLVWVVDRRVVVDQATDEAERIRKKLDNEGATPELNGVREGLRRLSQDAGKTGLIAISTLRGEKEDNREWSKNPSRPAIIVGTVDMIGSRLLFSGYGDGRYWRAQHAGLLGHDALVINDEAHLTPAFARLLCEIENIQNDERNTPKPLKPFRTVRLSATHPDEKCWPESLEEDQQHPHFKEVFEARKRLHIQTQPAAKLESAIIELATQPGAGRTIVFVEKPEQAQKLAAKIQNKVEPAARKRVLTLTGTMRGFERDQLVEKDEFKAFATPARPNDDYWLVATSAGEVGVNISSDRLITTLDTLDHLLQRFGRLNRFGETEGVAYLICGEKDKDKERAARKEAAVEFLQNRLPAIEDVYDISPAALFGLALDPDACTESPLLAPVHPWHIDVWSQTTLGKHPSRPEVEPWLHGKRENIAETYVAWREEVRLLERPDGSLIDHDDRAEILTKYRLLAHEQLREPTYKLVEKLAKLFAKDNREVIAWRRKIDGTVDRIHLPLIRDNVRLDTDGAIEELAYCQLILPPGCGKLENGMFQPEWVSPVEAGADDEGKKKNRIAYDVSGAQLREDGFAVPEARAAYLATPADNNTWLLKRLGGRPNEEYQPEPLPEWKRSELDKFAKNHDWRFLLEVKPEQEETSAAMEQRLVYFGPAYEKNAEIKKLFIDSHNSKVSEIADLMAGKLSLPGKVVLALKTSGIWHDIGKRQPIWQKAAGNWDAEKDCFKESDLVAKPIGIMKGRQLGGFRHEFSSLLCATADPWVAEADSEIREFVLHLIASHHGHGRPYFESKAYDKTQPLCDQDDLALKTIARFAKLQRKYGAWGLAYLESILRAADGLASEIGAEQSENG